MKGATHNLVVRTRTDVALYVLNHKRGHLRDLENSFKVTLAVIADPTVSGQQSFIIDRGEQVHTLEAAKALLAAQVAAFPPQIEEAFDDDEPFDIEVESEVETDETEGLTDETPASEAAAAKPTPMATSASGGGGGAAVPASRARAAPPATTMKPRALPSRPRRFPASSPMTAKPTRTRSDEQPGEVRSRSGAGRRAAAPPSRTSRRTPPARRTGGRSGRIDRGRTRTDIGSGSEQRGCRFRRIFTASRRYRPCSPNPLRHRPNSNLPIAASRSRRAAPAETETAQEAERAAARRRSTVREKVSFLADAQPGAGTRQSQPTRACPGPGSQPASETDDTQPRRAGWWSRRFGNGE